MCGYAWCARSVLCVFADCRTNEHGIEAHGKKETKCVYNHRCFAITVGIAPQLLLLLLSSLSLSSCCVRLFAHMSMCRMHVDAASAFVWYMLMFCHQRHRHRLLKPPMLFSYTTASKKIASANSDFGGDFANPMKFALLDFANLFFT